MHKLKRALGVLVILAIGLVALVACAPAAGHCQTSANGGDNDTQTTISATGNQSPETYTLNHSTGGDHITRTQTGKTWSETRTTPTADMLSGPIYSSLKARGSGTFNCIVNGLFYNNRSNPLGATYLDWGGHNGIEVQQSSFVIDHVYLNHNGFGVSTTTDPNNSANDGHDLRVRHSWFDNNYAGAVRNDNLADGMVLEGNLFRCFNSCFRSKASGNQAVSHSTLLDGNIVSSIIGAGGNYGVGPTQQCSGGVGNPCVAEDYEGWFDNGIAGSTGLSYALWGNTLYANVYPKFGSLAPPTITPPPSGYTQSDVCHGNTIDINTSAMTSAEKAAVASDVATWQTVCPSGLTINVSAATSSNPATDDVQSKQTTWLSTYNTGW